MPRESVAWLIYIASYAGIHTNTCRRREFYREILAIYEGNFFSWLPLFPHPFVRVFLQSRLAHFLEPHFRELVFAERPGLHNQVSGFGRTYIRQLETHTLRLQFIHKSGYISRQAGVYRGADRSNAPSLGEAHRYKPTAARPSLLA